MGRKHRGRQRRRKCARLGFLFEHPSSHFRPPFALGGSRGAGRAFVLFPCQPRLLARCRAKAPSVGWMQIVRLRAKAPPHAPAGTLGAAIWEAPPPPALALRWRRGGEERVEDGALHRFPPVSVKQKHYHQPGSTATGRRRRGSWVTGVRCTFRFLRVEHKAEQTKQENFGEAVKAHEPDVSLNLTRCPPKRRHIHVEHQDREAQCRDARGVRVHHLLGSAGPGDELGPQGPAAGAEHHRGQANCSGRRSETCHRLCSGPSADVLPEGPGLAGSVNWKRRSVGSVSSSWLRGEPCLSRLGEAGHRTSRSVWGPHSDCRAWHRPGGRGVPT